MRHGSSLGWGSGKVMIIWDMEPPEPEAELRSVAPVTHTGEPEPGVCVEGPPRGWYLLHLERQE